MEREVWPQDAGRRGVGQQEVSCRERRKARCPGEDEAAGGQAGGLTRGKRSPFRVRVRPSLPGLSLRRVWDPPGKSYPPPTAAPGSPPAATPSPK